MNEHTPITYEALRNETIGQRLRRLRIANGYKSQKSLVDALGMKDREIIGRIEKDIKYPDISTFKAIADKLGCTISYLLCEVNTENPNFEQLCKELGISEDVAIRFQESANQPELSLPRMPQYLIEELFSDSRISLELRLRLYSYIKNKHLMEYLRKSKYRDILKEAYDRAHAFDDEGAQERFIKEFAEVYDNQQKYAIEKTECPFSAEQLKVLHDVIGMDLESEAFTLMLYFKRLIDTGIEKSKQGKSSDELLKFADNFDIEVSRNGYSLSYK